MDEHNNPLIPPEDDFLMDEPPLFGEPIGSMPELDLDAVPHEPAALAELEIPEDAAAGQPDIPAEPETSPQLPADPMPDTAEIPDAEISAPEQTDILSDLFAESADEAAAPEQGITEFLIPDADPTMFTDEEPAELTDEAISAYGLSPEELAPYLPDEESPIPGAEEWDAPADIDDPFRAAELTQQEPQDAIPAPHIHAPRKGRPKRKKGYGFFGIPHLLATAVWLAIIVMIGTSLGRMLWVCAADVLAFGRDSKKVSITITTNDNIDDIARKLHEAELIRYPGLFKLYASIAVDDGEILPGTFELDTLYDYHALVVQMGPRSSTRSVVEDLLIPEGFNCRQIFELLEAKSICSVAELEAYAASGEFSDFWFLEGVERGDKYCLEGFLFPDTYDFYEHSTPREALGKMLLGFEARVNQEEITAALGVLNERLSGMMRAKGCSEDHIAANQLSLRDLLTVASLIEEETASSKESPIIASVIFNRLTEDQMYERYLNIDAAIIYATGDANHIDTSIDHPYNTYKYAGLTPGPISNPGLDSITASLEFEDTDYYYYVLNPETGLHQFSRTLAEHEQWVEKVRGMGQ